MKKTKVNISELFAEAKHRNGYLKISAPMVRYSKLEFRRLLRKYNVDLSFTPMIIAKSFHESAEARKVEFTTNFDDKPLIAQFAARNEFDLCSAAEYVYPYVDGIDINCGCPQKWAMNSGYGCALLKDPQLLYDMIRALRRILPSNTTHNGNSRNDDDGGGGGANGFSYSIKMRLLQNDPINKHTIDICRKFESCGVTFITVHGRTQWQKTSESVNIDALVNIKKSLQIPIVANGDIRTLNDAQKMYTRTQCDGVMSARGLLTNPTLFQGTTITPMYCIQDWIDLTYESDDRITFQCMHHHLTFMMEKHMKRKQRVIFNNFNKKGQIYEFLENEFGIRPKKRLERQRQQKQQLYNRKETEDDDDDYDYEHDGDDEDDLKDIWATKSADTTSSCHQADNQYNTMKCNGNFFNEFQMKMTTATANTTAAALTTKTPSGLSDSTDSLNFMTDVTIFDM